MKVLIPKDIYGVFADSHDTARLYSVYLDAVRIAEARRIEESNI